MGTRHWWGRHSATASGSITSSRTVRLSVSPVSLPNLQSRVTTGRTLFEITLLFLLFLLLPLLLVLRHVPGVDPARIAVRL